MFDTHSATYTTIRNLAQLTLCFYYNSSVEKYLLNINSMPSPVLHDGNTKGNKVAMLLPLRSGYSNIGTDNQQISNAQVNSNFIYINDQIVGLVPGMKQSSVIESNGIMEGNCFGKVGQDRPEKVVFLIMIFFSKSMMYIVMTFFLVLIFYRSIADLGVI